MKVIFFDKSKETLCSFPDVIQVSTLNCGRAMWRLIRLDPEAEDVLFPMSNYKMVRVEE